jgi:hypothetical protein
MVAGLVFAAHPIHAEAISTAVGRAELLCALMLVGVALRATAERPPTLGARLSMMALAAAALASKEMGVVAPAVAFAAAWTQPAQRRHAWQWTLSATLGGLPLLVARALVLGTFGGGPEHPAFAVGGWGTRTALALSMLPRTALALVVPGPAALDVAPTLAEVLAPNPLLVATGVVLVAAVVAAVVWHVRRPSAATLGVWIAAATTAPTSNLLFASGVVFGGRTLYAPSIGVALLAGVAVDAVLRRASPPRLLTGAAFAAWMVAASVFSVRDAGVWHDPDRLGATMLERQPTSYRAHVYAADLARQRGDAAGALPHYRMAMALFPRDQAQSYAGAVVALSQGDTTTALRWLDGSIALAPSHWQARTLRIKLALARNDRALALTLLDDGLRVTPEQRTWRAWRAALLRPSPAATP